MYLLKSQKAKKQRQHARITLILLFICFFFIPYCDLRDYLAHRSATEQAIRMSSTIKSCNHQLNYVILTFPFQKRQ